MGQLKLQKCIACSGDSRPVNEEEINELHQQVSEWEVKEDNGTKYLERVFKFKDFETALKFTNQIGAEAESQQHHPALLTEYGKVTVSWWTHDVGGLHQNDFIMAAKTDDIAAKF